MIKPIPKSDVVVRPFTTFKNWNLQNQSYDSFLTTEDGCPLFLSYVTESSLPCNVNPCYASYSLATEAQDVDSIIRINEGQSSSGIFYNKEDSYYNPTTNPTNRDGTYKRLVFDSVQTLFYNDFNNPLDLFGIEDYDSGKENRSFENKKIIVGNISNTIYGEKIQPGSVTITDNSSIDQQIVMVDDGYTNLIVTNTSLISEDQISAKVVLTGSSFYDPAHDRFGSSVDAWNNYIIAGAPLDAESFSHPKAGAAYLYKYDPSENSYRFIKNFYSPFTQNGYATEVGFDNNNLLLTEIGFFLSLNNDDGNGGYAINDNYGRSVSIDSNILAIGSPTCDFCGESSGSGHVYVYEKYKGGSDHWGIVNVLQGSCSLDKFGSSVSVSSTKMAIGAPGANNGRGRVYIFRQDVYGVTIPTSSYWFKLTPEDDYCSIFIDELTSSLSTTLNYAVDYTSSSCNVVSSHSSSVFFSDDPITDVETDESDLFDITSEDNTPNFVSSNSIWNLESIIETNTDDLSFFGASVSLSGSYLVVGNASPSSSVYLFESQSYGWVRTTRFDRDQLANTVSCSVCSYIPTDNVFNLYDPNTLSVNISQSYFGQSVSIKNGIILIGVPQDLSFTPFSGSNENYQVGSVYFYKQQSSSYSDIIDYNCGVAITESFTSDCVWKLITRIYESSSISFFNNQFGYSVAMDDDRFVVGSLYGKQFVTSSFDPTSQVFSAEDFSVNSLGPFYNDNLQGRVSVYTIETNQDGFYSLEKIISKQKVSGSIKKSFGYSVAIDNNHVVVGAPTFMYGDQFKIFEEENSSSYFAEEYDHSNEFIFEGEDNVFEGNYQPFSYDFNDIKDFIPSSISGSVYIYDMNELYVTHSAGNIFYKNGLIVITNTGSAFSNTFSGVNGTGYSLNFQGTHTIYEHEILCTINPGEFTVSTNPTSVIRGSIPYDINGDGTFDIMDFDLIMRYYSKFSIVSNNSVMEDDNGVVSETQQSEQWWGQEIILTESDDVIWLEPYIGGVITDSQLLADINSNLYQTLLNLDQAGLLDINGDGEATAEDSRILLNYFMGKRDFSLVLGNITPASTRTTSADVVTFLNSLTGAFNGTRILDTFLNYQESSSIDPTGSYLAPYITTIGLYSGAQLVAVAKLGQPIKNPINYPINFLIRYDT